MLAAAVLSAAAIPGAAAWLEWDRARVAQGEAWRLVTCHLTHFTPDHLLWDAAVFIVLGAAVERRSPRRFALCTAASALAIPAAIAALAPGIATYRGLSGIDSALFALYASLVMREAAADGQRGIVAAVVVLGIGFLSKVAYEVRTGAALFVASAAARGAMVPVPLAHLAGAAVGLAVAACPRLRRGAIDPRNAPRPAATALVVLVGFTGLSCARTLEGDGRITDKGLLSYYPRYVLEFPPLELDQAGESTYEFRNPPGTPLALYLYVDGINNDNRDPVEKLRTTIVASIDGGPDVRHAEGKPYGSRNGWILMSGCCEAAFWHEQCLGMSFRSGVRDRLRIRIADVDPLSPPLPIRPALVGGGLEL